MTNPKVLETMARAIAGDVAHHPWETMAENRSDLRAKIWDGYDVNEPTREDCRGSAQAALQALLEGGYVVLPAEPTEALYNAFSNAPGDMDQACQDWGLQALADWNAKYRAMVSTFLEQGDKESFISSRDHDPSTCAATPKSAATKVGDMRVRDGRLWRCYEIELEGAKFEDIGAANYPEGTGIPPADHQGEAK